MKPQCPICSRFFDQPPTGRRKLYDRDACRQKAHRRKLKYQGWYNEMSRKRSPETPEFPQPAAILSEDEHENSAGATTYRNVTGVTKPDWIDQAAQVLGTGPGKLRSALRLNPEGTKQLLAQAGIHPPDEP